MAEEMARPVWNAPVALQPLSPCLAQEWCIWCHKPHDMMTCLEAERHIHPLLRSFASTEDYLAKCSALSEESEKRLSDARLAQVAKWRKEVEAHGTFY